MLAVAVDRQNPEFDPSVCSIATLDGSNVDKASRLKRDFYIRALCHGRRRLGGGVGGRRTDGGGRRREGEEEGATSREGELAGRRREEVGGVGGRKREEVGVGVGNREEVGVGVREGGAKRVNKGVPPLGAAVLLAKRRREEVGATRVNKVAPPQDRRKEVGAKRVDEVAPPPLLLAPH
eukprot:9473923-Pyramimonas_sp.AAC.1